MHILVLIVQILLIIFAHYLLAAQFHLLDLQLQS